jgi:DNA polymerase III subunit delta'
MLFRDIIGLKKEKETLIRAAQSGQVAHAQMFYGIEGSANLALALAYANFLNCQNPGADDACGSCPSCTKNSKFVHPDVQFVFPVANLADKQDPLSKSYLVPWRQFLTEQAYGGLSEWNKYFGAGEKSYNIARIEGQQIISNFSMKAFEGGYKILILWMPELLHSSTANGLLKLLEEPPEKSIFLLVCYDLEKILPTILSRTQVFRIPSFTDDELVEILSTKYQIPEDKALQLAILSDGSLNKAIKLLEDQPDDHALFFRDWLRWAFKPDIEDLMIFSEKFQAMNKDLQKNFLLLGMNLLREALICQSGAKSLLRTKGDVKEFVEKFSGVVNENKIIRINKLLNEAIYHMERNVQVKILFFDLSFSISAVLQRK